jgi:glucose-6-phosphate dehydrogenase assembly protein OpcA
MDNNQFVILGREVAVSAVTTALHQIWQEDGAGTRASIANIAIYSREKNALIDNTPLLGKVTREHACRGILILDEQVDPAPPRAWVTAHCQLRGGSKAACSEQVSFHLQGATSAMLRNIVFSNLESDLPLTLWWQGDLGNHFEDRLYSVVDRLIIDSSSWSDPKAGFETLCAAMNDPSSRFVVNDLSWARSHLLRRSLANCFENPVARERLPNITSGHIVYGEHGRVAAEMLAFWIKERLGRIGNTPNIELRESESSISLTETHLEGNGCSYTLLQDPSSSFVKLRSCSDEYCSETLLPASTSDDADLVSAILERAGASSHYNTLLDQGLVGVCS